jgi:hypothetical protein
MKQLTASRTPAQRDDNSGDEERGHPRGGDEKPRVLPPGE